MLDSSTWRRKYMSTDEPLTVAHVRFSIVLRKRASLMPLSFVFGRSSTRNAAKLAVYEATMIMAKPAHTMPSTRAEKLRGVPSPMPLLSSTPQANQTAELRFSAFSSLLSECESLKRPNGENLSVKESVFQVSNAHIQCDRNATHGCVCVFRGRCSREDDRHCSLPFNRQMQRATFYFEASLW